LRGSVNCAKCRCEFRYPYLNLFSSKKLFFADRLEKNFVRSGGFKFWTSNPGRVTRRGVMLNDFDGKGLKLRRVCRPETSPLDLQLFSNKLELGFVLDAVIVYNSHSGLKSAGQISLEALDGKCSAEC
jgi:hypothetical protein